MSAPESVRTKDGITWTLRTVTSSGIALYAPKGVCECPAFVMATLAELAEHGIQSAELAAAVAEHGAFPVPVGPVPQELPAERLTEIAARTQAATAGPWWTDRLAESDGSESVGVDAGDDNWIVPCQDLDPADAEFIAHARADVPALLDEVARLTAQRDRRRTRLVALQNDALNMRGALSPNGEARKVPFPLGPALLPAVEWLIGRVAELESGIAWRDAERQRWAGVRYLVEKAIDKGWGGVDTIDLESELGPEPAPVPAEPAAEPSCLCPPADRPGPHQLGCPQAEVPTPERPVNELTAAFAPVAALREVPSGETDPGRRAAWRMLSREEPHDSPLHQAYRVGHDLPEGCRLSEEQVRELGNPFLGGGA